MKNRILLPLFLLFFCSSLLQRCTYSRAESSGDDPKQIALPAVTEDYWFSGKAEIAVYKVGQERYGEMREARQVMVFVTEDFSAKKQVKLDEAAKAGSDRIPILKLNLLRRFPTGIYDYSLMQSVFTPFTKTGERSLKITTTIQDWCGQVFSQLNKTGDGYRVRQYSYFEQEGDEDLEIKAGLLEDEIWTLLRLNPAIFSEVSTTIVPSSFYTRLKHKPSRAEPARILIRNAGQNSELVLSYDDIPRQLSIWFESKFPHRILEWDERIENKSISHGTLENILQSDYWSKSSRQYDGLRDSLGLKWF